MNAEKEIFADRLKDLRLTKGITQKELSEKIEVSTNTIISYEKAQKLPSLDIACKLALFFDVSLDWLSGISDKTNVETSATCDNVIRALLRLDALTPLNIRFCNCVNRSYDYSSSELPDSVIYIKAPAVEKFLEDWLKMKCLLSDNSIDEDLYNLWLEKQISDKKSIPI